MKINLTKTKTNDNKYHLSKVLNNVSFQTEIIFTHTENKHPFLTVRRHKIGVAVTQNKRASQEKTTEEKQHT